ncbi:hypothetical protein ACWGH3_29195 [Streptomyces sp. NPDC054884]|uniref:hypothetical protein n=1 Tax=Streptomyces sp. B21-105 TaxID=3039417 RepID=UPI002FEFC1D3
MSLSDGGSTSGVSWLSSAFEATRDAVSAQADMATEFSSVAKFRTRVDELIRDLKGSDAGPNKIGQEQLVRNQLGGGDGAWAEAAGLFTAYGTVISELETLSKLLSDSMEGMGIAVLASHKGYQNIDLDIRDRMAAISAETTEHYGGSYHSGLPQRGRNSGGGQASVSGDAGGSI